MNILAPQELPLKQDGKNTSIASSRKHNTNNTALAKFTASNNIDFSDIKWLVLFKTNCLAPRNTDSCSICDFKRIAIAEADRDKALNVKKS